MKSMIKPFIICLASFASLASAQKSQIPTQLADKSAVATPPAPIEPGVKGYGTRGVEGKTLTSMLDSCRRPSSPLSKVQAARCDQLERTLKTQPDGALKEQTKVEP